MPIANEDRVTIDHQTIRNWAEERNGYPATVRSSNQTGSETGLLRIGFEDEPDDELQRIDWDEFFEKFEEKALQMHFRSESAQAGFDTYHEFSPRR